MNNFDIYKLDELTHHITDGEHGSVKDDANSKYYLLSNKNIVNGQVIINDNDRKIAFETFKKINKRTKLEIGDVVISTVGVLGKTAIIKNQINFDFQRSVGIIKVNGNLLDNRYLYYYLNLDFVRKRINDLSKGAVQKCFFISDLKNLEIHLPENIVTQQKIAKVLSDLDAKIELNNKINAELEAMAKNLYDYWFVQFDFPDANGKPYKSSGGKMVYNKELKREIPEGWEVYKINDFIDVKDGTHDSPKPQSEGFPLITSKNLLDSGLDFENANLISEEDYININKRSKVESGDILFSMIGSIGVIYKVEEINVNFAIKNVALYKASQKLEYRNYVFQYLKSYDMQRYMGNVISGSIQKFIGLGSLRNMPFLFNKDVVDKFISKTDKLYQKIDNNKRQNQELASLRDWLLPMLMNGQVTVASTSSATEKGYEVEDSELGMVAEEETKNLLK